MNAMAMDLTRLPADILRAIAFLSRIPAPSSVFDGTDPRASDAAHAYALAGAVIALPAAAIASIVMLLGAPALLVAVLCVTGLIATTGALHEDGIADTADGFFGGHDRAARLTLMRDSRNGTYGTLALILSQMARVAALAALFGAGIGIACFAVIAAAAISRAAMAVIWHALPAARSDGVSAGAGQPSDRQALFCVATAAVIAFAGVLATGGGLIATSAGLALAAATVFAFAQLCSARIGGQTGDTLGAAQQLAEIAFLAVLAISV